jgi:hypothetical protein
VTIAANLDAVAMSLPATAAVETNILTGAARQLEQIAAELRRLASSGHLRDLAYDLTVEPRRPTSAERPLDVIADQLAGRYVPVQLPPTPTAADIIHEALLARRDGRLDEYVRDAAAALGITP